MPSHCRPSLIYRSDLLGQREALDVLERRQSPRLEILVPLGSNLPHITIRGTTPSEFVAFDAQWRAGKKG